jgi:ribosomal protein S18 acetylase RimI-like enzyme
VAARGRALPGPGRAGPAFAHGGRDPGQGHLLPRRRRGVRDSRRGAGRLRPAPRGGPVLRGDRPLTADLDLLRRLERQVHRGFARGSEIRETGAFRVYLWPRPEPFYRNRALPVAEPADWAPAIAAAVEAFAALGREPRVEHFAELWPSLPRALEAAGFQGEATPVLARSRPAPHGTDPAVTLLDGATPQALLAAFLDGAHTAFGGAAPDAGELAQLGRDLAEGATLAAARLEDGRPVAGACLIGVGAEAELAAVWTRPDHRRRGHASAVCAALAGTFLARGGELVWLSASGPGSLALYEKLGFRPVGTQLNYARPAP